MAFYDTVKIAVNITLVVIGLVVYIWFFHEWRINKLSSRLNKFSITKEEKRHSLFDDVVYFILWVRSLIKRLLMKSNYFIKYAVKYEKYINKDNQIMTSPMDYVATKFFLSFLFVFILMVSSVFKDNFINISSIIVAFTLGFFSLDFFLIGQKKYVDYEIKNDLLKAITIMNNCFKSGKSIIQTIDIVSEEIDGPLKKEFRKMHEDLAYGLELEVVFERFNKRVNLKEVKYITTSLNILNKTGGNVIDVFDLIEKTVFTNKKLEDELNNLSAASKVLYRILMFVPIVFITLIYFLDQTYFMPLFTSSLGILIVFLMFFIYVTYIVIIKKIIKIKEV